MIHKNILSYFEESASKFGQKAAVADHHSSITYSELRKRAVQLAAKILSYQSGGCFPVIVYLPNSVDAVVSYLAVLYAGCFYVPLSPAMPVKRAEKVCKSVDPGLVITLMNYKKAVLELGYESSEVVFLDTLSADDNTGGAVITVPDAQIDTDPMYIIHTSGSTGDPKGVVVSHRSVIDYVTWAVSCFDISAEDRIANQAPFEFDNSVFDIYVSLFTGATLVIVPVTLFSYPQQLADFLIEERISTIFWVPTIMYSVLASNALEGRKWSMLKKILFAGEIMPNSTLNYWRAHIPEAVFANLYGPTEITVDCTYYIVDREFEDSEPLPIGIPCPNTKILVLTEEGNEVPDGGIGELCVCGSSLALGYYKKPEETAKAFVQNPLNSAYRELIYKTGDLVRYNDRGELIFLGRRDSQVKIRGRRIELGEIDTALLQIEGIDNAVTVFDDKEQIIYAYYTGREQIEERRVKRMVLEQIPKYMVPACVKYVSSFPVNSNGKTDRMALHRLMAQKSTC